MKKKQNHYQSGFTLIEAIIVLVVVGIAAAMMAAYFGTSITQSASPLINLQSAGKLNKIVETITASYTYPYWTASNVYAPGAVIMPSKSGVRTGLLYTTDAGGTSGISEPDWSAARTINSTISDGTISWKTVWDTLHDSATENGAVPALVLKTWKANTLYDAYAIDSIVYAANGRQYVCIAPGTSGTTEPTWPTTSGQTVTESTGVQWQYVGYAPSVVLKTAIGTEDQEYTSFGSLSVKYRVVQNHFIKFSGGSEVNIDSTTTDEDYGKYLKVVVGLHSTERPRTNETISTLYVRR